MKKFTVKSSKNIFAAEDIGTTYYTTDINQILDFLKDEDANIWLIGSFELEGLDALNLENNLFGSKIIGDILYICVTDGSDININGNMVDPESALDDYDVEELSAYIRPADDEILRRWITPSEIYEPDMNEMAPRLMDEGYSFVDLMEDAKEFTE